MTLAPHGPDALPAADAPTPTVWVLTDGKAGDEVQCVGVARVLAPEMRIRRVNPRAPWVWLMPRGPIDPRDAPDRPGSPIAPPFPDILIASGRRAVAYVRAVKRASRGRTFTVILKDPRTGAGSADMLWVPAHDRLRGDNVLVTLTSPHTLDTGSLAGMRANPLAQIKALPTPRAAVIVGGDSRHHTFKPADIARFAEQLDQLAQSGVSLMGSRSRRTPEALDRAIAAVFAKHGGWWWDGTGDNPYVALLANAQAIVATADSVNMIGEAVTTGSPVLVFQPSGGHGKIAKFLEGLKAHGAVHHFAGRLEGDRYPPLDSTAEIASAIRYGWEAHRYGLRG